MCKLYHRWYKLCSIDATQVISLIVQLLAYIVQVFSLIVQLLAYIVQVFSLIVQLLA